MFEGGDSAIRVSLGLFGRFHAWCEGSAVTSFRSQRVVALLGYLALQNGPVARAQVAEALWPDRPPEAARHNLRQTLVYVKDSLGDDVLVATKADLSLNRNMVQVDVWRFRELLRAAAPGPEVRTTRLELAIGLYEGHFLEELEDEWATDARADLRSRFRRAALELARLHPENAAKVLERLIESDPDDPEVREAHISALRAAGLEMAADALLQSFREEDGFDEEFDLYPFQLLKSRPKDALKLAIAMTPVWLAMGRLRTGEDQVRTALDECRNRVTGGLARQARFCLAELGIARANADPIREMLEQMLLHGDPPAETPSWYRLHLLLAWSRIRSGRLPMAYEPLEVALRSPDPAVTVSALNRLSTCNFVMRRRDQALKYAQKAMALGKTCGDDAVYAVACEVATAAARAAGDVAFAKEAAMTGLPLFLASERPGETALGLARLGRNLEGMEDLANARIAYETSLARIRDMEDPYSLVEVLVYLGDLDIREGNPVKAEPLHFRAAEIRKQLGDTYGVGTAVRGLGQGQLARKDYPAAAKLLQESIGWYEASYWHSPLDVASALIPLTEAEYARGRKDAARASVHRAIDIISKYDPITREKAAPGDLLSLERAKALAHRVTA